MKLVVTIDKDAVMTYVGVFNETEVVLCEKEIHAIKVDERTNTWSCLRVRIDVR